ncbi:hypothetical protein SAMN05216374_5928 [Tardiphaga sp. OK246]|uniref:hypothetical protein n=1 Tax=Tardiphaga sp. OK246 TaxID=1855307 RepID=UPI000B6CF3B1|nr:hypothetical protein [Tardiphaga sp. OK246]SNT61580.1 hypothetical protein SAMN05216374_5928 [Tardiphaga sp. OK246]
MSTKRNTAQKIPADIALVVFGPDRRKKLHASRFGSDAAKAAQDAARAMGMRTIRIVTDAQREVASKLPKGTVSAKGTAVVPLVRPALYNKFLAVAGIDAPPPPPAKPPSGDVDKKAMPPTAGAKAGASDDWGALVRGTLVLATDEPSQGWFYCEVQNVVLESQTVTLLWKDYPELGTFARKITQVALLHPKMVKPC